MLNNRKKLNLFDQKKVEQFLKKKTKNSNYCSSKSRGIKANNKFGADFIRENLQIQSNLIYGCHINNINNLIFLGSKLCLSQKK